MKNLWLVAFSLFILTGCAEEEKPAPQPKSVFTGHFFTRSLSLNLLFNDDFTLLDRQTGERATYSIEFDRRTRFNIITNKITGDTVWVGRASRGNELWMMQTMLSDTSYWVGAIQVDGNDLLGFNEFEKQVLYMDSIVAEGRLNHMLISQNDSVNVLEIDRIGIQPYLESILRKMPARYQIVEVKPSAQGQREEQKHIGGFIESASYSRSRGFSIQFKEAGDYLLEITTDRGTKQVVRAKGVDLLETRLKDISGNNLKIRVIHPENEQLLDQIKLKIED